MSLLRFSALLAVSLLALSCAHLDSATPDETAKNSVTAAEPELLGELRRREHDELRRAAEQRLRDVRRLLKSNDFDAAEEALQPLVGQPLLQTDVNALQSQIHAARNEQITRAAKESSAARTLAEVKQRMVLPTKYNSTVVISRDNSPLEIPPGPMEELVNKKVTMTLQGAGVAELVQVLSDIEGLNVIADDALEAEKSLSINVRNVPLKEVLSYIARNMGVAFHLGESMIWVTESDEPTGSGPALETQVYRLRQGFIPGMPGGGGAGAALGGGGGASGDDNDLEDALGALLANSPDGATYRIFKNRNLLLVKDTRENLRLVESLIQEFDKPPHQVLIEARFITISQNDLRELGVEITDTTNPRPEALNPLDPEQIRVSTFISQLGQVEGTDFGGLALSGIIGNRTYDMVISALASKQSTRTLSAPRVTVLNNQSARLRKGDKILYYDELETVAASGGGDGGSAAARTAFTGDPAELELGVTFEVKVNVGNDGETVLLALKPEIIDLLRWRDFNVVAGEGDDDNNNSSGNAIGALQLPETTESTIETKVSVKSGETVILGGMAGLKAQDLVKKVPILGDIPWLGVLFRHTKTEESPQHLLIFVTARVLNDSGQHVAYETD